MREELSIRKAREEDFAAVRGLAEALAAHIEEPPPPLTHERYLAFYVRDDAPMQLFLAQRGDDVVGLIAWVLTHELYSADLCLFVIDVAVSSDARGQGVGKALMAHAQSWGRAWRCKTWLGCMETQRYGAEVLRASRCSRRCRSRCSCPETRGRLVRHGQLAPAGFASGRRRSDVRGMARRRPRHARFPRGIGFRRDLRAGKERLSAKS